jgi:hypothetical protein
MGCQAFHHRDGRVLIAVVGRINPTGVACTSVMSWKALSAEQVSLSVTS